MHFQRADADPLLKARAAASEEGATAGRQLFQAEGLAEHIIRSRVQQ
jgi:hypothetical protein